MCTTVWIHRALSRDFFYMKFLLKIPHDTWFCGFHLPSVTTNNLGRLGQKKKNKSGFNFDFLNPKHLPLVLEKESNGFTWYGIKSTFHVHTWSYTGNMQNSKLNCNCWVFSRISQFSKKVATYNNGPTPGMESIDSLLWNISCSSTNCIVFLGTDYETQSAGVAIEY